MMVPLLLLLIQVVSCRETVPVVVIDPRAVLRAGTITANPFHETTPSDFTDIIHDAIHLSDTILIFVEDQFSVEDISRRDSDGNPYKNIHLGFLEEKAKFLPSVVEPYKTLHRLLPPLETNVVYFKDTMKPLDKSFKYHYVYFVEPVRSSETRIQRLRRHDVLINEAYNSLSKEQSGPVLIFYTGKFNPMWKLGRSPSRPTLRDSSDSIMLVSDKALIRLNGVVLEQGGLRTRLTEPSISARSFALRRLSTRMLYHDDLELDFNFEYMHDNWILESVVLLEGGEEVGRTTMGVGAPYEWSYYCSEPLIVVNARDKSYITIAKYQIEPFRPKPKARSFQAEPPTEPPAAQQPPADTDEGLTVPTLPPAGVEPHVETAVRADDPDIPDLVEPVKTTFTNTQSCGTNFNCRILMGLFVTSIVLGITMAGIMFLYDCNTNNRMDDPNQKPLVIIASL